MRRHFFNGDPGVKARNLNENSSLADVFSEFVTEELFDTISEETNRFAPQQRRRRRHRADRSHMKKWTKNTRSEIGGFLALVILMGVVVKPELGQYWSTDPYLHTPVFPAIMPRDRFKEILKNLHFGDNYILITRVQARTRVTIAYIGYMEYRTPNENGRLAAILYIKGPLYMRALLTSAIARTMRVS